MANIGSWWLAPCEAQEGETVAWSCQARRTEDFGKATESEVGGKLFLTNKRLLFSPTFFDYALGGQRWATPLEAISKVDVQPLGEGRIFGGSTSYFGGAVRDRLRITLQNGDKEIFFVIHLKEKIERIRATVTAVRSTPSPISQVGLNTMALSKMRYDTIWALAFFGSLFLALLLGWLF